MMNISQEGIHRQAGETDHATCVIIGNGIAGMSAAVRMRQYEPDLPITVITQQNHPTVNTPTLKELLLGTVTKEQMLAFPIGTERDQHIDMIHAQVERIDLAEKSIIFSNGGSYGYESLLIVTGSRPTRQAPLPGYDLDGVMTLHRLRDYLALTRYLRTGEASEVVVVGGGVHASETVTGLLRRGLAVHWLIRGGRFYTRMLDHRTSEIALEHFQQMGARIWLETEIGGIVGKIGEVAGVITTRDEFIPCQLVLFCVGTTPVMALAEACDPPLAHDRGILVDDALQTSVPEIYAAG